MVKKYIKFLSKATNQHGVHSPFIYSLVTECIYKKSSFSIINEFEYYKKILENNHTEITITDFGAGSKVFKDNKRIVSDLVSKVSISRKYALLLNRIVNHLNINYALELGTSVGLGTASMCFNNINIKVDTIEGCDKILNVAQKQFKSYHLQDQITPYCGDFSDLLPLLSVKKYDLIYFDGNHQKEATLKYFKECLKTKHNNSVFIFDDIYWSDEMEEAWEEIKNHPEVKVTVDLFKWGLVFFRREQEKEHFKIRF